MTDRVDDGNLTGAPTPTLSNNDGPLSRRTALKILGAVPAAAVLGVPQPNTAFVGATVAHAAAAPVAPKFFTSHEWKTVRVLVDYIIPTDERSGSATDAKVPEYMDYLLAEKDANVNTQIAIRGGLGWLDTECQRRFQKTFIDATDAQRREVLDDIAFPAKAKPEMSHGVTFFNRFRDMTASGFFSSSIGWQDLKYMGNVFNPGYDGCPPAALEKLGVSYDLMKTRVKPQEK
ncbi:MAG TPA: gluconate 2-dehydrogenase subunit 3 family protein [Gemmatimonadaceae bacterium]|nr:gluconate 2-dehydrogenase subunit 3 family protein [Gemmatimonadaceae bacterium]